ncbi:MAG: hypothetical protein ACN6OD_11210 [Alcaligenes sp.]
MKPAPFVLRGRMSKKQRAALVDDLKALPPDAPRVLLATGKLAGEGFDHPPLDTLLLAMPISWKNAVRVLTQRPRLRLWSKAAPDSGFADKEKRLLKCGAAIDARLA